MSLLTVTVDDLRILPIREVAAICLRAAMRVQPLADSDCDEPFELAIKVLVGAESGTTLYEPVEILYQHAARAAAKSRASKFEDIGRIANAGAVIHSAIDCIADMHRDEQAALTNGMLALRSCSKLDDAVLSREVMQDFARLKSNPRLAEDSTDPLFAFGPLWSDEQPDWYRV